jgi:DNA-binding transcriptional LysR family regulator
LARPPAGLVTVEPVARAPMIVLLRRGHPVLDKRSRPSYAALITCSSPHAGFREARWTAARTLGLT